jgi:hypothetical protein
VPVLKTGDLARGPRVQISPPPPTSLDKRYTFSVSRRFSRCSARIARVCSPCLSSSETTSRLLGGVSLNGLVGVHFDRGESGLRVHMTVPQPTSLQRHDPQPFRVTGILGFGLLILQAGVVRTAASSTPRLASLLLPCRGMPGVHNPLSWSSARSFLVRLKFLPACFTHESFRRNRPSPEHVVATTRLPEQAKPSQL